MQAKAGKRIKQAAAIGTITPEQENEILTKIENRSKRREVRSQLIEKGIGDGTSLKKRHRCLSENCAETALKIRLRPIRGLRHMASVVRTAFYIQLKGDPYENIP